MICTQMSIMARILLVSAGLLTVVFIICGIAQGVITHTGHEKEKTNTGILDFAFTYDGKLPTQVTNVVGLGKSMASSATLEMGPKKQTVGLQDKGAEQSLRPVSPLVAQQLQLTDMSKVGSRSRYGRVQETYVSPSRRETAMTRKSGSITEAPPRNVPQQRTARKSETEILFRKLAKEILTKLFEKFMLKAAAAKSQSRQASSGNNVTRPLRGTNVNAGRGASSVITQAGIGRADVSRSPSRGLRNPKRPTILQSPPVQPTVRPLVLNTRRQTDGFAQSGRLAQFNPFDIFHLPAIPTVPPIMEPLPMWPQTPRTSNSTRSPFDFFRQYYQRQMQYEALEDREFFGGLEM